MRLWTLLEVNLLDSNVSHLLLENQAHEHSACSSTAVACDAGILGFALSCYNFAFKAT